MSNKSWIQKGNHFLAWYTESVFLSQDNFMEQEKAFFMHFFLVNTGFLCRHCYSGGESIT